MSRRLALPFALLSVLVVLVGGCSGQSSENAAENALEKAAEAQGGDVDVDVDGDKVKVESSDGTAVIAGGELPDGFPADAVPVLDGEILVGVVVKGEGFQVTVQSDLDPEAAFDAAVARLESAGVAAQEGGGFLGPRSAVLEGNGYSVLLSANDASGATAVSYIVAEK